MKILIIILVKQLFLIIFIIFNRLFFIHISLILYYNFKALNYIYLFLFTILVIIFQIATVLAIII